MSYRPLRRLTNHMHLVPGACAPGFTLSRAPRVCDLQLLNNFSLHTRAKHFLHQVWPPAAARRNELFAAVSPDWIRDSPERHQAFVIALLIAVVDSVAGKDSVAVVLVRADRADANIRAGKTCATVSRTRQVVVRLIARARGVIARIIE